VKKTIIGLAKLTRFNEYIYFVVITTILGIAAADGCFDWRFPVVIIANWLAVGFAFMVNDIEDAPDDALSTSKVKRNPVSSGLITPRTAWIASLIVGLVSAGLFFLLGLWPFILGLLALILGYLYSSRRVRLKTIAFFDIFSHCLMLAGLQFLCGYFTYTSTLTGDWFWPFSFVMAISIYGEFYNEIRDIEGDREAELRHTAIILGDRVSHILMLIVLVIGIFSGIMSFLIIDLVPFWTFVVMAVLAIIFIIPPIIKMRQGDSSIAIQGALQKPMEWAASIALLLQYLLPWLDKAWDLGLF